MKPHPVDQYGLAVRPPDIQLECNPEQCKYPEPFQDRQHVYHPRAEFKTSEEKKLRNCGRFVVRMCRCMHEEWDNAYAPPPKPDRDVIVAYNRGQLPIDKSEPL